MDDKRPIFLRDPARQSGKGALIPAAAACAALFALAGYFVLAPSDAAADAAPKSVAGTASVIDADTIDIHSQRIRLVGVDAPESGQKCLDAKSRFVRCGTAAANALDAWINRNPVSCAIEGKDKYGRLLGQCSVRGANMQEWLVSNGHALAYRSFSTAYVPAENRAKKARVGVWAGRFVEPWDWRKGARLPGEKPTKAMLEGKIAAAY